MSQCTQENITHVGNQGLYLLFWDGGVTTLLNVYKHLSLNHYWVMTFSRKSASFQFLGLFIIKF